MVLILSPLQIGIMALLDSISGIFVILFNLGYNQILIKLFPKFRDEEKGHNGFFVLGLVISSIGIILGVTLYSLLEDFIIKSKGSDDEAMMVYAYLIPILIIFRILYRNFDGYLRMLYKSVVGTFLDSFLAKFISLLGMLLMFKTFITFDNLVYIYVFSLCIPGLVISLYAYKATSVIVLPKPIIETKKDKVKVSKYILHGILMGASGSIVLYMDQQMLHKLIPENSIEAVGVYSIMFFGAMLIAVPSNGIKRISFTILAESWEKKDKDNINLVYKKSALNQMIIGFYLFLIGWACIDPVLEFLPKYESGKYVFLFLGIAQIIEMATGVNNEVIATSEKYYFNTIFNVILAIIIFISNFFFIQWYGIVGAGLASLIAMFIINSFRCLFLFKQYQLNPFNKQFLFAGFIGTLFVLIISYIDLSINPYIEIILNLILYTVIYWFIIIRLKLSEDINGWLTKIVNKIKSKP